MRILIGTPCAGGMLTQNYMLSMLDTYNAVTNMNANVSNQIRAANPHAPPEMVNQAIQQNTLQLNLYTLAGESLLQRGRNHIAQVALAQGYDKLMFIDADAGWAWPQLYRIITSPHDLIAGLCPLKVYPISLNFLPFAEDEKYFTNAQRSVESTMAMAKGHGSEVVKVPFVGTAFMCLSRKLLLRLAEGADHYIYPDPNTGQPTSHWDIFKVEAVNDTYLSEDWSACHRAREMGFDVHIDTGVIITHIGNHVYKP